MSELSEQEFEKQADATLRAMETALADVDKIEADLESGILTISHEDDSRYVINSHRAAKQIWMAAERTAWHFDWLPAEGRWVASRTGDELWATVSRVLEAKLGASVALAR